MLKLMMLKFLPFVHQLLCGGERISLGRLGLGQMDGHTARLWHYTWVKDEISAVPGVSVASVGKEMAFWGIDILLLSGAEIADLHQRSNFSDGSTDAQQPLCCFPGVPTRGCGDTSRLQYPISHPDLGGYSFIRQEGKLPGQSSIKNANGAWELAVFLHVNCGPNQYDQESPEDKMSPESRFWKAFLETFPQERKTSQDAVLNAEVRIFEVARGTGYWLPAYEVASYTMYRGLCVFYLALAIWWYGECRSHKTQLYGIHSFITLVIFASLMESVCRSLAFHHWDIEGHRWPSVKMFAVFAQSAKHIFSILILLGVAMGYSITRPDLPGSSMRKMAFVAVMWCVISVWRTELLPDNYILPNAVEKSRESQDHNSSTSSTSSQLTVLEVSSALLLSILAFWIHNALMGNLTMLEENINSNNNEKKVALFSMMLHCFIGAIVAGSALFAVVIGATSWWDPDGEHLLTSSDEHHDKSRGTASISIPTYRFWYNDPDWVISVGSHTMAVLILLAVIYLFRPGNATVAQYAYQVVDAADLDNASSEDHAVAGDHEDITVARPSKLSSVEMSKVGKSSSIEQDAKG